jgi:hypothetical protein
MAYEDPFPSVTSHNVLKYAEPHRYLLYAGVKFGFSLYEKNMNCQCLRTGCWGEYLDLRGRKYGNFSLHHRVQNNSGAHPASYPMGTRGSFPGVKRPGREADHSPPSTAEVKKMSGAIPPLPQYAFVAWFSVKAQGQLFYL